MRIVVTGCAGFIGSTLTERLLESGHEVVGADAFTAHYDRAVKERNLAPARHHPRFSLRELDLASADLGPLLAGADAVAHLAAQPGVRGSFGEGFAPYVRDNVLATGRLLETARAAGVRRFVFASSSSVYGAAELPMREGGVPRPRSPYGVTKLAAEHLCELYRDDFGLPTVSLRFFTVYGPRQRPDMAFHRFLSAALDGRPVTILGDGRQTRDFTFVSDAAGAVVRALESESTGVINVSGGGRASVNEVLDLVAGLSGRQVRREHREEMAGDVPDTSADLSRAREVLGWSPRVGLEEGLRAQLTWQREQP